MWPPFAPPLPGNVGIDDTDRQPWFGAVPGLAARAHNMVVNGEARTHMPGPKGNEILRGRVSGHLSFTEESVEKGVVLVEGLNFVTFGVDQESITGIKPTGKATSALGFTVSTREPQVLQFDEESQTLRGELRGQVSMDQFFELTSPKERGTGHDLDMRTLPAVLMIEIAMGGPLQPPKERGVETRKVDAKIAIRAEPYGPLNIRQPLDLEAAVKFRIEIGHAWSCTHQRLLSRRRQGADEHALSGRRTVRRHNRLRRGDHRS